MCPQTPEGGQTAHAYRAEYRKCHCWVGGQQAKPTCGVRRSPDSSSVDGGDESADDNPDARSDVYSDQRLEDLHLRGAQGPGNRPGEQEDLVRSLSQQAVPRCVGLTSSHFGGHPEK